MAWKIALSALIVSTPFLIHMIHMSINHQVHYRSNRYWFPPLVVTVCFFVFLGSLVAWVWE